VRQTVVIPQPGIPSLWPIVDTALLSLFFFSSRRRHTRCYRDWSSDVCSSDLPRPPTRGSHRDVGATRELEDVERRERKPGEEPRSEERRVGKECRSRGAREA